MNVEEESFAAIFIVCVCGQTASTTQISLWEGMKRHQEENNIECRLLWQQTTKSEATTP